MCLKHVVLMIILGSCLQSCLNRDEKLAEAQEYFRQNKPLLEQMVRQYEAGAPHILLFEKDDDDLYSIHLTRNTFVPDVRMWRVSLNHDTVKKAIADMGVGADEIFLCRSLLDSTGLVSIGSVRSTSEYIVSIGYRRYAMSKASFIRILRSDSLTDVDGRPLDSNWVLQWGSPAFDGTANDEY